MADGSREVVDPVTGLQDTDAEAAAVQRDLFRRAGPGGRIRAAASLSHAVLQLARRSMRAAMPGAAELDVSLAVLARLHGIELANAVRAHLARRTQS